MSTGEGSVLLDCPTSRSRCQSQVQVVPWDSDQLARNGRFPQTPSLDSLKWLEQLTELREGFYLLNFLFIIKGYRFP